MRKSKRTRQKDGRRKMKGGGGGGGQGTRKGEIQQ